MSFQLLALGSINYGFERKTIDEIRLTITYWKHRAVKGDSNAEMEPYLSP
jgi:hypothetical protein